MGKESDKGREEKAKKIDTEGPDEETFPRRSSQSPTSEWTLAPLKTFRC
jgi:hypothetical protein